MQGTGSRLRAPVLALALAIPAWALALEVEELDAEHPWVLGSLSVEGTHAVDRGEVLAVLITRPRPWWAPWRSLPDFDPIAFRQDVERVQAFYRRRGHYQAVVHATATVDADGRTVQVVLAVEEGPAVRIGEVQVLVEGERATSLDALIETLPVRRDEPFDESEYDKAHAMLRRAFRDAGYARVSVAKHARVDLDTHEATVTYRIASGPKCVFGGVRVDGTRRVEPDVVRAEVTFRRGEPFREEALDKTRKALLEMQLFLTVRVEEEPGTGEVVDVRIDVREAPPRDIRLGLGYDTEEGPRGIASWRHYDFFGGGRQLGVTARGSLIQQSAFVDFIQPHWPMPAGRFRLLVGYELQDEESYNLSRSSLSPRLEWRWDDHLTAYVFYRLEYDQLDDVPVPVQVALPFGAPRESILSGVGVGVDAVFADDPIDPTRGMVFAASVEGVGLGGDVHLVRVLTETSVYHPLGVAKLFGAARLRLGLVNPIAGDDEVPLFERLYSGGSNSVRGYERRHVGPLADDDPIGGRSLAEMSVEIRRVIVGDFGGAVFLDAGAVGLEGDRFALDDIQLGTGFGVRYRSPVGPIRLDLGFPLDRPRDDASWQVHVSIGRAF
jgi:outer membrane protein insertion porin family/translocation and assembly module TamA